ncbi:hypothetical protein HYQ46_003814 [Verticillium longisporum]|nr:hypothetical protein HYQ46_003814 [Verticillium longisporum]
MKRLSSSYSPPTLPKLLPTRQSKMKFTTVLVGLVAFFSTAAMALPSPVGAETVDKDLEKRQMCSPCYRGFRSCCSTGGNCYTAKC